MTNELSTQRIDVWLWHGRFYKTRSLATKMVRAAKVRLNGKICKKSSSLVSIGDMLTFVRADEILIVKIINFAPRRGSAPQAQLLYQDLTPPKEIVDKKKADSAATRIRGSGRPTKDQRRAIDKLMSRD